MRRGTPDADRDAVRQLLGSPAIQRVRERRTAQLMAAARGIDVANADACRGMVALIQAEAGVWEGLEATARAAEQIDHVREVV